jgi:hypothetical protein
MWMLLLLRILAGMAGGTMLWIGAFLYEDEHRRIQHYLEDIWFRIRESHERSIGWHQVLIRASAFLSTLLLTATFRKLPYSRDSYWLAYLLVAGTLFGLLTIETVVLHLTHPEPLAFYCIVDIAINALATSFFVACMLDVRRGKMPEWQSVVACYFMTPLAFFVMLDDKLEFAAQNITEWITIVELFCAVLIIDALFSLCAGLSLVLLSNTLRFLSYCSVSSSPAGVALWAFGLAAAAFVISFVPLILIYTIPESDELYFEVVAFAGLFGMLTVACSLVCGGMAILFDAIVAGLLIHKLLWLILERPLYFLQGLGIARRKWFFVSAGSVLTCMAFPESGDVIRAIVSLFL